MKQQNNTVIILPFIKTGLSSETSGDKPVESTIYVIILLQIHTHYPFLLLIQALDF